LVPESFVPPGRQAITLVELSEEQQGLLAVELVQRATACGLSLRALLFAVEHGSTAEEVLARSAAVEALPRSSVVVADPPSEAVIEG
jgi:hypothetical protein